MTEPMTAHVTVDRRAGTITITAPIDAPKTLLLGAARHAHALVERQNAHEAHEAESWRAWRGRTDVFELHHRLRSWQRTLDVIRGDVEPGALDERFWVGKRTDELARDVRSWVRERVSDVDALDARQLRRWANQQPRFSTDADYYEDEADWTPPAPPAWFTALTGEDSPA